MTLSPPSMDQLPFPSVPVTFLSSLSLLSPSRCSPRVRCCVQCCSVTFLSSFSLLHVHLVCSAVLLLSCLPSLFFMSTSCAVCSVTLLSLFSLLHVHLVCSAAPVSFLSSIALLSTSRCPPRVQCCIEWQAGVEDSRISISLSFSFRRRSTPSPSFQFSLCLLACSTRLQCCTER